MRAERHAKADLSGSLTDGVRQHAVQAQRREQQPGGCERSEQDGGESVRDEQVRELLAQRHHVRDRLIGIDRAHLRANGCGNRGRIPLGADDEIQGHVQRECERLLRVRRVPDGARDTEIESILLDVPHDADDGHPRTAFARADAPDALADGILSRPRLTDELLADHDDGQGAGAIVFVDEAA